METKQVTVYEKEPVFYLLSEIDQKNYLQNGLLEPQEYDLDSFSKSGKGLKWISTKEMRALYNLFLTKKFYYFDNLLVSRDTPQIIIKSDIFDLIRVEVFKENYLIECKEQYLDDLLLYLLHKGFQVQIVGEKNFIRTSRLNKKYRDEARKIKCW